MISLAKLFTFALLIGYLSESESQAVTSKAPAVVTTVAQSCTTLYGKNNLLGVCKDVDYCKGAAMAGNCGKGSVCCVEERASSYTNKNAIIDLKLFLKVAGNTERNSFLYNYFVESMDLANIKTKYQAAAYLAQLLGESNYFENLESTYAEKDFSWSTIIGDYIYGPNGEGSIYRGRGAILLRGKSNYDLANGANLRLGYNITAEPERVAFPSLAFKIAAWIWDKNSYVIDSIGPAKKKSLNILADGTFLNFVHLTHSLTDSLASLNQRAYLNEEILKDLSITAMKRGQGVECNDKKGYAVPICLQEFKKPYCGCEGEFQSQSCPYGIMPDGKCRNSEIIKCCSEKCFTGLDLVFLLDSSGSIGDKDFEIARSFIKTMIASLEIGQNDTRVGLINFNTNAQVLILLSDPQTPQYINSVIDKIKYSGGNTNTAEALKFANERVLLEKAGMRPVKDGVPKVVLVLTDGASNVNKQDTLPNAKKIKDRGVNIISVGVGKGIELPELIQMASSPNDQYFASDYSAVIQILSDLTVTTCKQPAITGCNQEIVSKVEKNNYKYFKLPMEIEDEENVNAFNKTYLDSFTIELEETFGRANLYFSFEDESPKSSEDYVNAGKEPQTEQNFIEKEKSSLMNQLKNLAKSDVLNGGRSVVGKLISSSSNANKKYYQVKRPTTGQNEFLYFSVKGLADENQFQVFVYNRTVNFGVGIHKQISMVNLLIGFLIALSINLFYY